MLAVACWALAGAAAAQDTREIDRLFRGGDTAAALRKADEAIAQRPRDAALRFQRAVMLSELKRTAEAVDALTRMTEDFPELPEPYNNLAVLHAASGQIDRARELLETALRHDPSYFTAHENLGDIYVRLALRAYERAAAGARAEPNLQRKLRLARELAAGRP
ncbi:MAG: tetratricopeptide repeat protein [Burkholderiaceae bacterium]